MKCDASEYLEASNKGHTRSFPIYPLMILDVVCVCVCAAYVYSAKGVLRTVCLLWLFVGAVMTVFVFFLGVRRMHTQGRSPTYLPFQSLEIDSFMYILVQIYLKTWPIY